ncbi:hypothetical protein CPB85DRAFT_1282915, partial [Mucidula mucida]
LLLLGRTSCKFRPYSTTTTATVAKWPLRLIGPERTLQFLRQSSEGHLWTLLDVIRARRRLDLHDCLRENGVSFGEYAKWDKVVQARDIATSAVILARYDPHDVPHWLVLFVIAYQVQTPMQAAGPLVTLADTHYPRIPAQFQPALLVLTAHHLARFSLVRLLHRVVEQFLAIVGTLTPQLQNDFYNLFLQSLSKSRVKWGDSSKVVFAVLTSMESHQAKLWSSTYRLLLNDRHVTMELTIHLRDRMIREGFVPTTAHLQDYVRVFANSGAIQNPERYRQEIAHDSPQDVTPSVPGPNMTERQWNAAFASAAASHGQVSAASLISSFTKAKKNMRMSVYNYTILIRALLLRKQYGLARMYWHRFASMGFILDAKALSVGLKLFAEMDQPHKAFNLLEVHAARVNVSLPAQYRLANPVVMNIICMNDLLWSLRYMRRPDALAFFHRHPLMCKTRDEAVALFKSVLGDNRNPKPEPYKPFSVWKEPAGRAQELFWQAMRAHRPHGPDLRLDATLTNVVPSGANCFDYAVVAMLSGRAEELPKILYAMKELGIAPVDGMVPLVLTVWHGVCAEHPQEGDGPWRMLVDWISEWLGEKALPSLEDMGAWRVKVLQMKGLVPSTWETAGRRYSSEREEAKFQAMWSRSAIRPMRAKGRRRLRRRREREEKAMKDKAS